MAKTAEEIRAALNRKFKRNVAASSEERKRDMRIIPTNIPSLDLAIGNGGLVGGRIVECWGQTGCHSKGQEILMYDGSIKLVEDVEVGDKLMGPDNSPREVLSLERGREQMVDIIPIKGDSFRVNINHILSLIRTDTGEIKDVKVSDYLNWSKRQKRLWKLFRSSIVNFNSEFIPDIPPYIIGALLGDGGLTTNTPSIHSLDESILKEFKLLVGKRLTTLTPIFKNKKISGYYLGDGPKGNKNRLTKRLEDLNMMGVSCGNKSIPFEYKTSSYQDRLELLAGLLDTDGSLSYGGYDYISKSERLAEDVVFIARSLGLAAYVKPCKKGIKSINFIGDYWRVSISGDCSVIPVRVEYKKAKPRKQIKDVLRTGFKVVEVGEEDYYGFSLTGDGRFLLGDFTVTHNCGKSLFLHTIGGLIQQAGGLYGFCDAEGTWDDKFCASAGVNTDTAIVVSQPKDGDAFSGEEFFEAAIDMIDGGVDIVGIDSSSALTPKDILKAATNEARIAASGLLLRNGLLRMTPTLSQRNVVAWFISQTSAKINSMGHGPDHQPSSGRKLPYFASYRFELKKIIDIEEKIQTKNGIEKVNIGVRVGLKIVKNKTSVIPRYLSPSHEKDPNNCHAIFNIILKPCVTEDGLEYKRGVDITEDYVTVGLKNNLINKGGPFFSIKDVKEKGKANFIKVLRERPDLLSYIKENSSSEALHDGAEPEAVDQDGYGPSQPEKPQKEQTNDE